MPRWAMERVWEVEVENGNRVRGSQLVPFEPKIVPFDRKSCRSVSRRAVLICRLDFEYRQATADLDLTPNRFGRFVSGPRPSGRRSRRWDMTTALARAAALKLAFNFSSDRGFF